MIMLSNKLSKWELLLVQINIKNILATQIILRFNLLQFKGRKLCNKFMVVDLFLQLKVFLRLLHPIKEILELELLRHLLKIYLILSIQIHSSKHINLTRQPSEVQLQIKFKEGTLVPILEVVALLKE